MSENKSFILKKVTPGDVFAIIHPMSNPSVSRIINLTDRTPNQILPADWALGFVMDQGTYSLYKQGYVTFDDNDGLAKLAVDSGVWFDTFDFKPAEPDKAQKVLEVLKTGNRAKIQQTITANGEEFVKDVASKNIDSLTVAVTTMLESMLKTQFVID